jgi:hypothetical protein
MPPPARSADDASVNQAVARIRELTRPNAGSALVGMMAGAAAGAPTGANTGPVGIAIGAVIGSAIGASSGVAMDLIELEHRVHDEQLDRDIGVSGGDIGAGDVLTHPPPRHSLFSAGVAGAGGRVSHAPAEGPMTEAD